MSTIVLNLFVIDEGDGDYVQMVIHLDEYFASALFYLGYRPIASINIPPIIDYLS